MTVKVQSITNLKSPKAIFVKKALVIGAAVLGLIAVGAVAFVAVKPSDDDVEETSE